MAKITKEEENDDGVLTPAQQAMAYMSTKEVKGDHYNFEKSEATKTRCSSLLLSSVMDGGIPNGAHRALGITRGGKTSCLLDFMYHFLRVKGRRGLYVKSEGRLSPEMQERSGIKFVSDPLEWKDGTCLIFECNIHESIFGLIGNLIKNNPTSTKYFFVLDSMDMIVRRADMAKGLEDAQQVAGGALITSTFLKQTSLALEKRGHVAFFISQVRDEIKGQYDRRPPRQGSASGGHALEHQGTWVLEFLPRWERDKIYEGTGDNQKIIGHYCKVKILKSTNEKDDVEIRYPIRYGRKNATSVWIERELFDILLQWGQLEKAGAWLKLNAEIIKEVQEKTKIALPEKIQGMDNFCKLLEDNPVVANYLFEKFLKIITGSI